MRLGRVHNTDRVSKARQESRQSQPVDPCGFHDDKHVIGLGSRPEKSLMQRREPFGSLFNDNGFAWLLLWSLPGNGRGKSCNIHADEKLILNNLFTCLHGPLLSYARLDGIVRSWQAVIYAHDTWSEPHDTVQVTAVPRMAGITLSHAINVASGKTISLPSWNTVPII